MKSGGHLSDQTILLALDGEMGSRETDRVKTHLEACWTCRVRREQIERVISDVVEFESHDEVILQLLPRPRDRRSSFLLKLDELIEQTAQPSVWQLMSANLWKSRRQLGFAAVTLAILLFAARLLETPPSVSANELLRRANASLNAEFMSVNRPVVYRKIRIRSGNDTVTRTIYRDPATRRVSDRMDPPASAFLQAAFTHAGFDWQEPLSASDYSAWRGRLAKKSDEVRQTGVDSLVLSTSTRDGLVQEASLTVRASDWHPVAEHITLYDSRELEIIELDFRVLSMEAVGPGIFETSVAAVPPVIRTDGPKVAPETPESPKGPTQAELGEVELRVLVALHNAKADAGEDIAVLRLRDEVVVQGVVETQARKQELAALLARMPHVQPQVQTLAEALLAQGQPQPGTSASETQSAESPPAPPLLQQALEKQFPNVEDRSGFINQALDVAQDALAHSSALQHLGTRYRTSAVVELSPELRRELAELLLDHRNVLRQQLLTERVLVSALMPASESSPAVTLRSGTWQETVAAILPDVRRIHSGVAALFAGSRVSAPNAASTAADLRLAMAHLDALLKSLSDQVNDQLHGNEERR
jgi:hypothetical protein